MMTSLAHPWPSLDQLVGSLKLIDHGIFDKLSFRNFQTPPSVLPCNSRKLLIFIQSNLCTQRQGKKFRRVKCMNEEGKFDHSSIEQPPYYSYMDSTSGQLEPASGARASIPGREYWPEGTASRVASARAPEPVGKSDTKPSYGKNPGSRRRKYKGQATNSKPAETSGDISSQSVLKTSEPDDFVDETKEPSEEYVIYQTEPELEHRGQYEVDKEIGRPHPFVNPALDKPIEEPRPNEDLWWNWRKPEQEQWSRWQRRRPDVDTVFAKAMAETGQIKLFGDHPTQTEAALARARKNVLKEERLQVEQRRLEEVGPIAYYSEWVKGWNKDTSREAIQKHYKKTGEDENTQLITMFEHQTAEEYRIMMGTDVRIKRDPLAMRMREELIKEIWGGDPVYPTINYIQDPDAVIDYRGPDFHEPTPNMLAYLMEQGKIISRQELEQIVAKEKSQELEITDMDEALATAVDIGEDDDGEEGIEEEEEAEEKSTRNWSILKTIPQPHKSKEKRKKGEPMSLAEAVDDSENITDFLMDFDEEE